MDSSTLAQHEFDKGKFIPPLMKLSDRIEFISWCKDRLPEMLWLALIYSQYDRQTGLEKTMRILTYIKNIGCYIELPYFSLILNLPDAQQVKIYEFIKSENNEDVLSPLTLIFNYSEYPVFAKAFYSEENNEDKKRTLLECIKKFYPQQDECTTDIRYLSLYFEIITGRMKHKVETLKSLFLYPKIPHSDERMRNIRPTIRSCEGITPFIQKDKNYLKKFWEDISSMTDCKPFYITYKNEETDEEIEEIKIFFDKIMKYYASLYEATKPLDDKMLVLIGIFTYSYKRFSEIIEYNLYNSIVGRSIIRVLIEDYIMIKYLLKKESEKPNIWTEYQSYGIGQLKLIEKRFQAAANTLEKSHVEYKYLEFIVNDYINEEFLNMDTKYFDSQNIRLKAEYVNEKDLFGLYYDYDSSFEHGLWGAIRECALLKCEAAGHQYHCVPDYNNNQKCKSIWYDSVVTLLKTIKEISNIYSLSDELKERMSKYAAKYSI